VPELTPQQRSFRAKIAGLSRDRAPDDPELLAAKAALAAANRDRHADRAEEYIRQLVSEAPTLTDEQRARIAALLQNGGDDVP
jgi:hypothetical protein